MVNATLDQVLTSLMALNSLCVSPFWGLVQAGHHLILRHRHEALEVETTRSEVLTLMRRDQAHVLLRGNGQLCKVISRNKTEVSDMNSPCLEKSKRRGKSLEPPFGWRESGKRQ
jgi:hypothetical protein